MICVSLCAGLRDTNADADTDAETRQKQPLSGQPTNHSMRLCYCNVSTQWVGMFCFFLCSGWLAIGIIILSWCGLDNGEPLFKEKCVKCLLLWETMLLHRCTGWIIYKSKSNGVRICSRTKIKIEVVGNNTLDLAGWSHAASFAPSNGKDTFTFPSHSCFFPSFVLRPLTWPCFAPSRLTNEPTTIHCVWQLWTCDNKRNLKLRK